MSYLYGGEFIVYTDNNPLTYVLTSAKLDATGQRWIAALANYNFNLHYKSGKTNIEADALSRIPNREEEIYLDKDAIRAITNAMQMGEFSELNDNPTLIFVKVLHSYQRSSPMKIGLEIKIKILILDGLNNY